MQILSVNGYLAYIMTSMFVKVLVPLSGMIFFYLKTRKALSKNTVVSAATNEIRQKRVNATLKALIIIFAVSFVPYEAFYVIILTLRYKFKVYFTIRTRGRFFTSTFRYIFSFKQFLEFLSLHEVHYRDFVNLFWKHFHVIN